MMLFYSCLTSLSSCPSQGGHGSGLVYDYDEDDLNRTEDAGDKASGDEDSRESNSVSIWVLNSSPWFCFHWTFSWILLIMAADRQTVIGKNMDKLVFFNMLMIEFDVMTRWVSTELWGGMRRFIGLHQWFLVVAVAMWYWIIGIFSNERAKTNVLLVYGRWQGSCYQFWHLTLKSLLKVSQFRFSDRDKILLTLTDNRSVICSAHVNRGLI